MLIKLPALRLKQPIGEFFIATISAKDLWDISFFDIRRLEGEQRGVETYLGIQRPISKKRVSELQEYVQTAGACFPTSIILAVDGRCARYEEEHSCLILEPYTALESTDEDSIPLGKIARVLDGQHRIAGLELYAGMMQPEQSFDLNVTIFIDMDIAEQGQVFATVNLAQTKVNKSLVYDLAGLVQSPIPQKVCHRVAVILNEQEFSPFYKKIKRLGVATAGRFDETLTQATFVESLIKYMTDNPLKDRDLIIKGISLSLASENELRRLPLRNLFISNREVEIAKIIWAYFDAVRERWPDAWVERGPGTMLYRTNGFKAFMRFFGRAYLKTLSETPNSIGSFVDKNRFRAILNKVTLTDTDFNINKFKPGGAGELALFNQLLKDTEL